MPPARRATAAAPDPSNATSPSPPPPFARADRPGATTVSCANPSAGGSGF